MAKNKDYSTGNAKRWATIFGIVVFVAIIVVVILLVIPPNTYNAVQTLHRNATTSYLTSTSEKSEFNTFKEKVNASIVNPYTQEFYNIETLAGTIDIILDFHDDYLVFAKKNDNLNKNYKNIREGLIKAKSYQKQLVNIIKDTNKLSNQSSTYIQSAIVDYREVFVKYLKSITRAIGGLENAYTGSLVNVTFNNDASALILNVINDYFTVITNSFKSLVEVNVKGGNTDEYTAKYDELGLNAKISFLSSFVKANLEVSYNHDINCYYFENSIQEKYQLLNSFFTVYSEENTIAIIESMKTVSSQNQITKTYSDIADAEGAFNEICKFVKGEV